MSRGVTESARELLEIVYYHFLLLFFYHQPLNAVSIALYRFPQCGFCTHWDMLFIYSIMLYRCDSHLVGDCCVWVEESS